MIDTQLFCIPYAGAGAGAFDALRDSLDPSIELVELVYAGHGRRAKEPFYQIFSEMVADVAEQIRQQYRPDCRLMLLGYSMGSIVTYELLANHLLPAEPIHVFLAAHEAPDVEWEAKKYTDLEDQEFLEKLTGLGGFKRMDVKMLENRFFYALYFKPIRADYRLLCAYEMKRKYMLECPTTVFYSPQDQTLQEISSWKRFLREDAEFVALGENHFFLNSHPGEMTAHINRVKEIYGI